MTFLLNVPMTPGKKKQPTKEQAAEARRLRQKWEDAKAKDSRLTQTYVGDQLEMTQGAVWQYLSGNIAMSDWTIVKFAALLEFDPREIRPDIYDRVPAPLRHLGPISSQAAAEMEALSPQDQLTVLRLVEGLRASKSNKPTK